MKHIDFGKENLAKSIFKTAIPMLVAQIINLLYNIVDRIYIARIPQYGTKMLGAVGICFPIIITITAFTNLYGTGGSPVFGIAMGKGERQRASDLMDTSFLLEVTTAVVLMVFCQIYCAPILKLFGASEEALIYAVPYMRIYLCGTLFSMVATGMNPFITAQGFSVISMLTVLIGAVTNIILDPIFIFVLHMDVRGAAAATVISQMLSAVFVIRFLMSKNCDVKLHINSPSFLLRHLQEIKDIVSLGLTAFIVQITNSLVSISCNKVLSDLGGDMYVSVMTIIVSMRQMMETPMHAITDGSGPVLSYNYGAEKYSRVRKAIFITLFSGLIYIGIIWIAILVFPAALISIFTNDKTLIADAVPSVKLYFSTFGFMALQSSGQSTFRSLNKKKQAIFFSIFRKIIIVVPLTYALPYLFGFGVDGVFIAEPVSNFIGGVACFVTMLIMIMPELKRLEQKQNNIAE